MRTKKLLLALTLVVAIGASATVYAAAPSKTVPDQRLGLGRITGIRGYDYAVSVLKDKLGFTDKEITDGISSGKTMFGLAEDKGMTAEEFKAALIEKKSKAVDDAVSKGTITKEQGDSIKENLKNFISSCTGNCGQMQGRVLGNRGRMMGQGQRGIGSCPFNITGSQTK